ncbi:E3 ubiquitin-protein ligase MARCH3-like [Orbicella faveolata]|uniref:E3 ubiquitin-protein ligase MARCH3-like n=1 Tax=Orbicella faveolata TaxID=48498 RepID=UPI0009E31858|nr:E3 ubiquitin-protein ligase MARCH3-like [Orbicella faveolata]
MAEECQTPAVLPVSCSLTSISLGDDLPMCRICHNTGGEQNESLHRVCWCKGTMGEVHKSCLETWLSAVYTDRCPICNYHFRTKRIFKPIRQWQCPPMPANDIAMLVFTVVFFGMFFVQLTGMAILVSYYEQQPTCHTTASLGIAGIGTGLPFFLAFSIGLTMNIYFSRYWAHWRRTNKHVIVYLDSIEEVVVA